MDHFTASDGRRIAFADSGGDGPPVLCLAGLTRDSRDFSVLIPHLTPDFRLIAMDYRGRGQSGWAEDPVAEYDVMVEARDAVELLFHLGLPGAAIIGTSRGGLIGMGLAAQMPGLVKALVLNDIGPELDLGGVGYIMTYLGKPVAFPDFDAAGRAMMAEYGPSAPDLTEADWIAYARRSFHEDQGRPTLSYDPKLRDAVAASVSGEVPDLWAIFDGATCPAMVLRGLNSNLLTGETVARMVARKPELAAIDVANRGHCPLLDEPVVLEALIPFLKAHA